MFHDPCAQGRRFASILAVSISAVSASPCFAAHPARLGELLPAPLPVSGAATSLIAAADSDASAQIAPPPAPAGAAPRAKSTNATVNLIHRLVEKKILTEEEASDLIAQSEQDAAEAREQVAAVQQAAAQVAAGIQGGPPPPPAPPQDYLPSSEDSLRVTYIPEVVKEQLREEIKHDLTSELRDKDMAEPHLFPDWVTKVRLFGDFRFRYEGDFYPTGNDATGAFPNFNSINTGAPYDTSSTTFAPQLNVNRTRERFRIRVRLGVESDLGEGFTMGIRLGSGQDDSPVTGNQSLGAANNGQGGNFSKYQVWIDRAFLKYTLGDDPNKQASLTVGRFDNPFLSTTIIWAADLGFDGAVFKGRYELAKGFTPYLTFGAFPVFNTDLNFATTNPSKFKSSDKWLYAAQTGADWTINHDFAAKFGLAYYYFQNVSGKLSTPFTPLTASDQGNTDDLRPSFAQTGNTYMALRNIVPNALNNFGTIDQFQYYGLASAFREVDLIGQIDFNHYEPFQVSLIGEYIKNVAFDRNSINAKAVNNRGPTTASGGQGSFTGTDTASIVSLRVGSAALQKRGDWNLGLNYRYVGSDSVIDGFCDSDYALGGTNVKGYTIFGALALSKNVNLSVRYFSSDQIAGPPLHDDIIQVDLNGKF